MRQFAFILLVFILCSFASQKSFAEPTETRRGFLANSATAVCSFFFAGVLPSQVRVIAETSPTAPTLPTSQAIRRTIYLPTDGVMQGGGLEAIRNLVQNYLRLVGRPGPEVGGRLEDVQIDAFWGQIQARFGALPDTAGFFPLNLRYELTVAEGVVVVLRPHYLIHYDGVREVEYDGVRSSEPAITAIRLGGSAAYQLRVDLQSDTNLSEAQVGALLNPLRVAARARQ